MNQTPRQLPIRRFGALIAAAACALVLAGCGLSSSSSTTAGSSSPKTAPDTCGDFLALHGAKLEAAVPKSKKVQSYTGEGVRKLTLQSIYAAGCKTHAADYNLLNLSVDAALANCSTFAKLSPALQDNWLAAVYREPYYKLPTQLSGERLLAACTAFNAGNLVAASNEIAKYGSNFMTWHTESRLGYQEQIVLVAAALQKGKGIIHPNESGFAVGTACGYDPSTDAAIPLTVVVANETAKQSAQLSGSFELDVEGPSNTPTTTAYLEGNFSGGAQCSSQATEGIGNASMSIRYTDKTASGDSVSSSFYVIIKNYFSPRNPNGAANELSAYHLRSVTQASGSDPVVQSTSALMPLRMN